MNNMRFLLLLSSLVLSVASFSQGQGLLWKVERSDLVRPSYLFGTIHMISADKFELPNELLKVAKEARKHVFEANLSDLGMGMMQKLMLPEGKSIQDFCSEEHYNRIKSFFIDSVGMSSMEFAMMSKMQPVFLSQAVAAPTDGLESGELKSYELELMKVSQEYDKSIEGLETIDDQIGFLKGVSMKEQIEMLLSSIQSVSHAMDQMEELESLYTSKNLDSIANFMQSETGEYESFNSVLLDKRNADWIPKLEQYFQESNIFIAVGAAHLAGSKGIIEQLRAKGYAVTPIW